MYRGRTPITVVQESGPPVLNMETGRYETPSVETVLWGDIVPSSPELVEGRGASLTVRSRVLLPAAFGTIEPDGPVTAITDTHGSTFTVGPFEPHYFRGRLHHYEAMVERAAS